MLLSHINVSLSPSSVSKKEMKKCPKVRIFLKNKELEGFWKLEKLEILLYRTDSSFHPVTDKTEIFERKIHLVKEKYI